MVNRKTAIELSLKLIKELKSFGYNPDKAFLFGSVIKGNNNEYSDIDLALWDKKFIGCMPIDWQPIIKIISKYTLLELHTFNSSEDEYSNPFIADILKNGIEVEIWMNWYLFKFI